MRYLTLPLVALLLLSSGCSFGGDSDSPLGSDPETLAEARTLWVERGPTAYRFRYRRDGCFCSPRSVSATVYVRADTVWKFEDARANGEPLSPGDAYQPEREHFPTVGKVFELIAERASEEQLDEIVYDGELGYPRRAAIGPFEIDGGVVHHLSDLESQ